MRFRVTPQTPVFSVTLRGTGYHFHPGAEVEAPADSPYIQRLIRKGILTPLPLEAEPPKRTRRSTTEEAPL